MDQLRYDCHTDCLLLRNCNTYRGTSCGGSLYLRSLENAPGSSLAAEEHDSGQCYAGSSREVLDDFQCTEASYCVERDWTARHYPDMSLVRCAALCRATNCQAFQCLARASFLFDSFTLEEHTC